MAERKKHLKTNLTLFGRLGSDPKSYFAEKNQRLQVEIGVFCRTGRNYPDAYVEFIVYDQDVCEYLMENFKKGDLIYITNATPAARSDRRWQTKFVCWNVALKETVDTRFKTVRGDEEEGFTPKEEGDGNENADMDGPF